MDAAAKGWILKESFFENQLIYQGPKIETNQNQTLTGIQCYDYLWGLIRYLFDAAIEVKVNNEMRFVNQDSVSLYIKQRVESKIHGQINNREIKIINDFVVLALDKRDPSLERLINVVEERCLLLYGNKQVLQNANREVSRESPQLKITSVIPDISTEKRGDKIGEILERQHVLMMEGIQRLQKRIEELEGALKEKTDAHTGLSLLLEEKDRKLLGQISFLEQNNSQLFKENEAFKEERAKALVEQNKDIETIRELRAQIESLTANAALQVRS